MTQERIEQMRNQIKADEKYGKGPNYASWSDECGVLLSRKEAQEILDELTTLRQQLGEAKEKNQYLSLKWSESDLKRYRIESENAALKKVVEELTKMSQMYLELHQGKGRDLALDMAVKQMSEAMESRDEFAIKFAEWVVNIQTNHNPEIVWSINYNGKFFTVKELLNQFKNENPGNTDPS